MNYVEYVHASTMEQEEGTLWLDTDERDIWIMTPIKPAGVMVRLKDGKFTTLYENGSDTRFERFRGHLSLDTEALK